MECASIGHASSLNVKTLCSTHMRIIKRLYDKQSYPILPSINFSGMKFFHVNITHPGNVEWNLF